MALERLGTMIRSARESSGMTGRDLSAATGISQSRISKIETGKYGIPDARDVERLLDALSCPGDVRDQIRRQLEMTRLDPSSYEFIEHHGTSIRQLQLQELERDAALFRVFQPAVFPGLVQLEDYAFNLLSRIGLSAENAREAAVARAKRQLVLAEAGRLFSFVICEAVLYSDHRLPHQPSGLAQQLTHVLHLAQRRNIALSIIPGTGPVPAELANPFYILDNRYVSAETVISEQASTRARDIATYARLFTQLERSAVNGDAARELLERAITNVLRRD